MVSCVDQKETTGTIGICSSPTGPVGSLAVAPGDVSGSDVEATRRGKGIRAAIGLRRSGRRRRRWGADRPGVIDSAGEADVRRTRRLPDRRWQERRTHPVTCWAWP